MQIKDIFRTLESWAPLSLQASYDNSGLVLGDDSLEVTRTIITLDVTEAVIDEAIETDANLIIAHHPLIFSGIKQIGVRHWLDKCLRKAIKHDLNIYAIHTNLDHVATGVNQKIADRLGLNHLQILRPMGGTLLKLSVFVPTSQKQRLLDALYQSGAGEIGNYSHCSFQILGEGTFLPNDLATPTVGQTGKEETVQETRIEVMIPKHAKGQVLSAMKCAHPYEEVAYYLSELINDNQEAGAGMVGELACPIEAKEFLLYLKNRMNLRVIRHSALTSTHIQKVVVCGGSGSFLLKDAIAAKGDVFVTSDVKYHDFFEANDQIIIADIGHYESEIFTKDLIMARLTKFFPNLAVCVSRVDTNPINYL